MLRSITYCKLCIMQKALPSLRRGSNYSKKTCFLRKMDFRGTRNNKKEGEQFSFSSFFLPPTKQVHFEKVELVKLFILFIFITTLKGTVQNCELFISSYNSYMFWPSSRASDQLVSVLSNSSYNREIKVGVQYWSIINVVAPSYTNKHK